MDIIPLVETFIVVFVVLFAYEAYKISKREKDIDEDQTII